MVSLPGLTKDPDPPATDTQISPITIPDGTVLVTTKVWNKIIDYLSGDASPDFIPQSAIGDLPIQLVIRKTGDTLVSSDTIDPDLTFPVNANEVWKIDTYIQALDTPDDSSGETIGPTGTDFFNDDTGFNEFISSILISIDPTSQGDFLKAETIMQVGGVSGDFEIRWLEEDDDYTVTGNSFLIAWRIA